MTNRVAALMCSFVEAVISSAFYQVLFKVFSVQ